MARRNRNSRTKDPAPGWLWMLFGLVLGLVVAGGVYFSRSPATPSAVSAPAQRQSKRAPPAASARAEAAGGDAQRSGEPQFDFYEILPQYEVVVPEVETAASPRSRSKPVEEPGSYVLQAGSFRALGDADRLQASIALLGIESRIQKVTIDDDVFHRVRIGPISDLARLNRIRSQLHDARIETQVMKIP